MKFRVSGAMFVIVPAWVWNQTPQEYQTNFLWIVTSVFVVIGVTLAVIGAHTEG